MHASSEAKKSKLNKPLNNKLNKAIILTKAIRKLAIELDLTQQELSLIIGRSKSTFSRLFNDTNIKSEKQKFLMPFSKEGQLAILLLRLYRNLDVLFGGNQKHCQLWLRSENEHLETKPIELIKSVEGLVTVVQYLDAIKGKN
jgi:hypothetical protein